MCNKYLPMLLLLSIFWGSYEYGPHLLTISIAISTKLLASQLFSVALTLYFQSILTLFCFTFTSNFCSNCFFQHLSSIDSLIQNLIKFLSLMLLMNLVADLNVLDGSLAFRLIFLNWVEEYSFALIHIFYCRLF